MNGEYDYGGKGYGCFTIFVSGAAIIIAIISLLKWDDEVCNVSGESITIAVLSALITFVVAWQIWQTIASKEEIKEARLAAKKANKVAKDVSALNIKFKDSLGLFAAYRASSDGLSFLLDQRHYRAFHLFATAIIDSLKFMDDQGRCAMGALVNLQNTINFDEDKESMEKYTDNWDSVKGRLTEIEKAIDSANQENKLFQTMAKHHIEEFKKAAREKGFEI